MTLRSDVCPFLVPWSRIQELGCESQYLYPRYCEDPLERYETGYGKSTNF